MNSSTRHVGFIDQLRGIAILAVLLCHTVGAIYGYDIIYWSGWFRDFFNQSFINILLFPFSFGQAGVAIFFVVSGFCIHMSFEQQGRSWNSFFVRRFFRLYPAYFVALVFFILMRCTGPLDVFPHKWEEWRQLLTHVFLVHNFHPATFSGINEAFWSLGLEVQLYALYPLLLLMALNLGWKRAMLILGVLEFLIRGANSLMALLGAENTSAGKIVWLFSSSPLGYWFIDSCIIQ